MTLADLRKLTVRKQIRIRFQLTNGMECVIDEHGLARVPALREIPEFDLSQELATARDFLIEPVAVSGGKAPRPENAGRDRIAAMLAGATPGPGVSEHEEE